MIALLQRVSGSEVVVNDVSIARIGRGLLALVGIQPADNQQAMDRLVTKILRYRIFEDDSGKMNFSLQQIDGDLLLVPQFTLAADTRHGLRPGFSTAAAPELGKELFAAVVAAARTQYSRVQCGQFGAYMQVSLTNDGPATFWLES